MDLIEELIKDGYLKTSRIIEAFRNVSRADFLPEEIKHEAEMNIPLPIGFGQTISQPLTVAFMLELLQPQPGDKVLDIGSGSGWVTAILAYIVSQNGGNQKPPISSRVLDKVGTKTKNQKLKTNGKIYSIERICELEEFGKTNLAKYNFLEKGIVEMKCGDGTKGWEENAPYDKIHAAASARTIPQAWKDQLKIGGKIVAPAENSIWLLIKKSDDNFEEREYPGFAFVPLIQDV